jgi:lipoate-protein ligase A
LVLGSTQDQTSIDEGRAARAGVDVVRRSTGGGAVLVAPDTQVWLDLWLPRGHDLWDDDVIEAAAWVGDSWVAALRALGAGTLRVHRGPMIRTAWSDRLCFAGFGPGEVSVVGAPSGDVRSESTGPKVMGLAQRRTRAGARFHTSAPLSWDPEPILALFKAETVPPPDDVDERPQAAEPLTALKSVAVGLRAVVPGASDKGSAGDLIAAVEQAVITALP